MSRAQRSEPLKSTARNLAGLRRLEKQGGRVISVKIDPECNRILARFKALGYQQNDVVLRGLRALGLTLPPESGAVRVPNGGRRVTDPGGLDPVLPDVP